MRYPALRSAQLFPALINKEKQFSVPFILIALFLSLQYVKFLYFVVLFALHYVDWRKLCTEYMVSDMN